MAEALTFQDFMWIFLTSGLFLLVFSLPRFVVHGISSSKTRTREADSFSHKSHEEMEAKFLEDSVEIIAAGFVILIAYYFLFGILDGPSKLSIAIAGLTAMIFVMIGYPLWNRALLGKELSRRQIRRVWLVLIIALIGVIVDVLIYSQA